MSVSRPSASMAMVNASRGCSLRLDPRHSRKSPAGRYQCGWHSHLWNTADYLVSHQQVVHPPYPGSSTKWIPFATKTRNWTGTRRRPKPAKRESRFTLCALTSRGCVERTTAERWQRSRKCHPARTGRRGQSAARRWLRRQRTCHHPAATLRA